MASNGRPAGEAIHATAVAIAGEALLILGPSGSGKSRLALALIAANTKRVPIKLIGDDRVLLSQRGGLLVARGHPRIQGFIERRGLGILACPFFEGAPVRSIVDLGCTTAQPQSLQNFPCLPLVTSDDAEARRDVVLHWWRGASTTPNAKPSAAA